MGESAFDSPWGKDMETTYNTATQLTQIPKDLWDLFIPLTNEDMNSLEVLLSKMPEWEKERNEVMLLQYNYDLPLRPNMSLRETLIRVRIEDLRRINKERFDGDLLSEQDID